MTTPDDKRWFQSESFNRILQFLIGALATGIIFYLLQFSTSAICCGDFDGYYHVQWSRELWASMKSKAFPPAFPWLPLTTLNPKDYVDHHLLFHIFQIPFVAFSDPRLGAKIVSALFGSLAVLSCYWLLLRHRIRYPLVWLVALLACSAPFLYRMNMAKAPPIAIIYTALGIYLLFQKRYLLLLPLTFLFVWTYSLFIIVPGMAFIWMCIIGWSERRFEWRP